MLDTIVDELRDYICLLRRKPRWNLSVESRSGVYLITIDVAGVPVVDVGGRHLETTSMKALDMLRAWIADQPSEIARTLEQSIEEMRELR